MTIGSSVCFARMAVEQITKSGLISDRLRYVAIIFAGKLGATGGTGDYIAKPKGMHWRTFERAMARIRRAEDIVDMHEALLLGRLEESFPDKDR